MLPRRLLLPSSASGRPLLAPVANAAAASDPWRPSASEVAAMIRHRSIGLSCQRLAAEARATSAASFSFRPSLRSHSGSGSGSSSGPHSYVARRCLASLTFRPTAARLRAEVLREPGIEEEQQQQKQQQKQQQQQRDQADNHDDNRDDGQSTATPAAESPRGVQLRPYQEECIQDCLAAIAGGVTRIGVSSPTGSGKTTIFTHLIHRIPTLRHRYEGQPEADRVLVLVNSIELALQAAASISSTFPGKLVEIEQGAKFRASGYADVTVATVQTLHRSRQRLEKFNPLLFKALIVDEAHHAAAPSYRDVLAHFDPSVANAVDDAQAQAVATAAPVEQTLASAHGRSGNRDGDGDRAPKVPIIGFSATFTRHDGLALGKVFERIVFHKDFLEMIDEKWLCPIRFTSIKADIDLTSVKLSSSSAAADFQSASLAAVVNTPIVNRLVLKAWTERAQAQQGHQQHRRRSTLIFAVDIQHVEDLTDTFCSADIDARCLHGGTPMPERRQLLHDFRQGLFPVLVNCAILTEGADVPAIDCVLLARPTRSRNLFSQMIGRGLRLSPQTGKSDCLILDIVGNIQKGVVCTPTLFGLDADEMIEGETAQSLQERATTAAADVADDEGLVPSDAEAEADALSLEQAATLTYIDYEDPFQLHKAMQARSKVVETMSQNAWVDCGAQTYILDVPRFGFVRVERLREEEDDVDAAAAGVSAASRCSPVEEQRNVSETPRWVSHFTPVNSDADESLATMGGGGGRARRFGGASRSPYRRARRVMESADLESAIRGSDQYVQKQILRGAPQLFATLSRYAKWRSTRASDSQRKLVEKRLGLTKALAAAAATPAAHASSAPNLKPSRTTTAMAIDLLTKGQAAIILARLMHGAKARWQQRAKNSNRAWKQAEKDKARLARETVQVGPLS